MDEESRSFLRDSTQQHEPMETSESAQIEKSPGNKSKEFRDGSASPKESSPMDISPNVGTLNDENSKEGPPKGEASKESSPTNITLKKEIEDEEEDFALEDTNLGTAIDAMLMSWCQFITNMKFVSPVPPSCTRDHVKETAEVWSRNFRDSCADTFNEFYRLGLQWQLENFEKQEAMEEEDLDRAIARQEELIEKVVENMKNKGEEFYRQFPDAGKYFQT
ncbi:unnamed protein product [Caenorhabditis bovis]|uniref:Uncharacterized protein n=1 Tax=Caenorhabditis bovis TaxID=2654633 RepID=A0A8S1E8C3_9PELO|nr:unnamed protein product [Caenorhabditis bovis]